MGFACILGCCLVESMRSVLWTGVVSDSSRLITEVVVVGIVGIVRWTRLTEHLDGRLRLMRRIFPFPRGRVLILLR